MKKDHHHLESGIISHFSSSNCNVIFESKADIQGFKQNGLKVIGEFKSEAEHKKNYSWWSDWKDRLEKHYIQDLPKMKPKNKRWLAVVDGQLREYCKLEGVAIGYLVVENFAGINSDIIEALEFLKSQGRINSYSGPTVNLKGLGFYLINY